MQSPRMQRCQRGAAFLPASGPPLRHRALVNLPVFSLSILMRGCQNADAAVLAHAQESRGLLSAVLPV
jgi:hypothetical protein